MESSNEKALRLERHYSTTPDQLIAAWTEPEKLRHWFAPDDVPTQEEFDNHEWAWRQSLERLEKVLS